MILVVLCSLGIGHATLEKLLMCLVLTNACARYLEAMLNLARFSCSDFEACVALLMILVCVSLEVTLKLARPFE